MTGVQTCALPISSDSNPFATTPKLNSVYQIYKAGQLQVCWIRTKKYKKAKSIKRIISWLDFEMKLAFFPFYKLPKPDAIIVSSLSLFTIINGLLLKIRFKAKLIFEIRDIWPLTIIEEGGFSRSNIFVKILGLIEKTGYAKSDLIIGTMPNLIDHVQEITAIHPPVKCVPMGFDPDVTQDIVELEPGFKKKIPVNKFIIGYAGTIGTTNALEVLLECARRMVDVNELHFVLAGDGDLRSTYQQQYQKISNITFLGKVPKQQVQELLRSFDVLYLSVFNSKVWKYGQSLNKVIDYMLAGKPIIASYAGFPSMINEAACGTIIPSGDVDALLEEIKKYMAMGSSERETIGRSGKNWIHKYRAYSNLAKQYINYIDGIK